MIQYLSLCCSTSSRMAPAVVFLISMTLCQRTSAEVESPETQSNGRPKLIVLLAASNEQAESVENQLVAQLRLTLDDVVMEQVFVQTKDFLSLPLPEQLDVARPLISRFDAVAAVWITQWGKRGNLIQFVVSSDFSSTIRTAEAGSPEELALAVRELLNDSYLINPERLKKKKEPPKEYPNIAILSLMEIGGGVYDPEGASFLGGVGFGVAVLFTPNIFSHLDIIGKVGPREEIDEDQGTTGGGILLGWRLEPRLAASYLWWFDKVGVGPTVGVSVMRSSMNIVVGNGEYTTSSWWSIRGALGLDILFRISSRFSLNTGFDIGVLSKPKQFVRRSDPSSVLMETPLVDYAFHLGVLMGTK